MKTYARIYEGSVIELVETDRDITTMFHPDFVFAEITGMDPSPVVGWSAVIAGGDWEFAKPVPPQLTDAELKAIAIDKRDALLAEAREATVGMADAYVAGLLSAEDAATFKAFASYQLALNKIDKQPRYPASIDWPAAPGN